MHFSLQQIYDADELQLNQLFLYHYNCIPSCNRLNIPVENAPDKFKQIINLLDLPYSNAKLNIRNWSINNEISSDLQKDYPAYQVFVGQDKACIIEVQVREKYLYLAIFIDIQDKALEQWSIQTIQKVRHTLLKAPKASFYVLSKNHNYFAKEEIDVKPYELNIQKNYNDDFIEVHEKIQETLASTSSGLILLHGLPGTGKTSYIKYLLAQHRKSKFLFIPNDFVGDLLDPSFVSFLLENKDLILIIEDAEKVIISRENAHNNSVVSTILQLTDGLFSDFLNIKIICTFNTDVSKIDTALLRKGRLIARYEFQTLSLEKTNALLKEKGYTPQDKSLSLTDIFNYQEKDYQDYRKSEKIGF